MDLRLVRLGIAVGAAALCAVVAQAQSAPKVVKTVPEIGAKDVDPALTEIRVTFDQDMAEGYSWTGSQDYPDTATDKKPYWEADKRTIVRPVQLFEGRFYRMGVNSSGNQNFRSIAGVSAELNVIYFATKGADEPTLAKLAVPKVVSMEPANGAKDVPASTTKLAVTFDRSMGLGLSWTKTDGVQPEGAGKPEWNADRTVCTLPVKLVPGQAYSIGLNHPFANNFQSAPGVPLAPVVWKFTTAAP
jgi:hypothetical protein